ncbi:MAG: hypothetical protein U0746_13575 [Gemmataceae bacterium]
MAKSRTVNGHRKEKERARRDQRMAGLVEKGKMPFTPPVLTWLSQKLDMPSSRITQELVDQLVKAHKAAKK